MVVCNRKYSFVLRRSQVLLPVIIFVGTLSISHSVYAEFVEWGGNGHFYEARLAPGITWPVAQTACGADGGYLATLTSAAEGNFVFGLVNDPIYWNSSGIGPWLGGFRPAAGVWEWVTGELWSYTNWQSGQPNGAFANQYCLQFSNLGGGAVPVNQWNDQTCTNNYIAYVCEKEPTVPVHDSTWGAIKALYK